MKTPAIDSDHPSNWNTRIIGAVVIAALLLVGFAAAWCLAAAKGAIAYPGESAASFHLRALELHGKDDRDVTAQAYHAEQLVQQGDAGLEVLFQAIVRDGAGPRYDRHTPGKRELAIAFGAPMKQRIETELAAYDGSDPARYGRLLSLYFACFADYPELLAALKAAKRWSDTDVENVAFQTVRADLLIEESFLRMSADKRYRPLFEKLEGIRASLRSNLEAGVAAAK